MFGIVSCKPGSCISPQKMTHLGVPACLLPDKEPAAATRQTANRDECPQTQQLGRPATFTGFYHSMGTSHSCETTDDALGRKVLEVMSDHSSHLAVGSSPAVPQDRLVAQMGTEGPLIFQICRDSSDCALCFHDCHVRSYFPV